MAKLTLNRLRELATRATAGCHLGNGTHIRFNRASWRMDSKDAPPTCNHKGFHEVQPRQLLTLPKEQLMQIANAAHTGVVNPTTGQCVRLNWKTGQWEGKQVSQPVANQLAGKNMIYHPDPEVSALVNNSAVNRPTFNVSALRDIPLDRYDTYWDNAELLPLPQSLATNQRDQLGGFDAAPLVPLTWNDSIEAGSAKKNRSKPASVKDYNAGDYDPVDDSDDDDDDYDEYDSDSHDDDKMTDNRLLIPTINWSAPGVEDSITDAQQSNDIVQNDPVQQIRNAIRNNCPVAAMRSKMGLSPSRRQLARNAKEMATGTHSFDDTSAGQQVHSLYGSRDPQDNGQPKRFTESYTLSQDELDELDRMNQQRLGLGTQLVGEDFDLLIPPTMEYRGTDVDALRRM